MNLMNHDNGEMQLAFQRRAHLTNVQRQVVFEGLERGKNGGEDESHTSLAQWTFEKLKRSSTQSRFTLSRLIKEPCHVLLRERGKSMEYIQKHKFFTVACLNEMHANSLSLL